MSAKSTPHLASPSASPDSAGSTRSTRGADPRFDQILASANDAIISIDESQHITLFNRGAERIFGHAAADIIGQPLDLLIPERFVAHHAHSSTACLRRQALPETMNFSPCNLTIRSSIQTGAAIRRIQRGAAVTGRISTSRVKPRRCLIA